MWCMTWRPPVHYVVDDVAPPVHYEVNYVATVYCVVNDVASPSTQVVHYVLDDVVCRRPAPPMAESVGFSSSLPDKAFSSFILSALMVICSAQIAITYRLERTILNKTELFEELASCEVKNSHTVC
jgi:hypothetical protein